MTTTTAATAIATAATTATATATTAAAAAAAVVAPAAAETAAEAAATVVAVAPGPYYTFPAVLNNRHVLTDNLQRALLREQRTTNKIFHLSDAACYIIPQCFRFGRKIRQGSRLFQYKRNMKYDELYNI